jgi:hypothetical protein
MLSTLAFIRASEYHIGEALCSENELLLRSGTRMLRVWLRPHHSVLFVGGRPAFVRNYPHIRSLTAAQLRQPLHSPLERWTPSSISGISQERSMALMEM